MGEVGGDDEDGGGVGEVGREEVAVGALGCGGGGADEDGDDLGVVCWVWDGSGITASVRGPKQYSLRLRLVSLFAGKDQVGGWSIP